MEGFPMNNLFIVIALVIGIGILFAVYHIGQAVGLNRKQENEDKEQHATYLKEILTRDREIQTIRGKLDDLNQLNDRYLSFLVRIPTVVQRLNATLKVEEIILSVIDLVTDIIPTKIVECYILDSADNLLKNASSTEEEEEKRAIGEGMVGITAHKRMSQM